MGHRGPQRPLHRQRPLAPPAMLGDVFAEFGYDIDTFDVVPQDRVDDPGVRRRVSRSAGLRRHRPPRRAVGRSTTRRLRRVGGRRDGDWCATRDAAGVGVLGVCFGGQLIAQALGGSVARSPDPEIGWYHGRHRRARPGPRRSVVPVALRPVRRAARRGRTRQQRQASQAFVIGHARWACSSTPSSTARCSRRGWPTTVTTRRVALGLDRRRIAFRDSAICSPTPRARLRAPGARLHRPGRSRQPCPS